MKISYNWLKEYIDLDLPTQDLSDILTGCGLEVEQVEHFESIPGGLNGLVAGEVKSKKKHPNADKLSVTTVDIGEGRLLQIVCGAPNVEAGQKVVVAPAGTKLHPASGVAFTIKKTNIRGEDSEGMICAEDEIGLGSGHDGILVLDASAKAGVPASRYFCVEKDTVFSIGLTPNRIDAASHLGTARDLAAVLTLKTGKPLSIKQPSVETFKPDNQKSNIKISVEDPVACPRYCGLSISGLQVKESPLWLQNRLKTIGLNSINNVVDVTNFVLHETGQPLHAFDAGKIKGNKVIVKKLPEETPFITLDGKERKLSSEDLMICNESEGMCIAGVFGGKGSEVDPDTVDIFLESACFDPLTIRKTSKRHELNTDASFRFERGADPNITIYALKRAALLVKELCKGQISSDVIDIYPQKAENFKITFSYTHCDRLIGKKIDRETIKQILSSLGITIEKESEKGLSLSVPPFKPDVRREVDVIEEILRIYGYNNIEIGASAKFSFAPNQKDTNAPDTKEVITGLLADCGFTEIMNNSITKGAHYQTEEGLVKILNPINADLNVMRKTLLYGGLETLARNQNRQRLDLKLFEFGKSYIKNEDGSYREGQQLGIFVTGRKNPESWNTTDEPVDIYYLKGMVDKIISRLGIDKPGINATEVSTGHIKGRAYEILKKHLVKFGEITAPVTKKFDIKNKVYFAVFNWGHVMELLPVNKTRYSQLPRYPSVRRDLALLLSLGVTYSEIELLARKTEKKLLRKVNIFDVYKGEKVGKEKKSYAVSFLFQDEAGTLKDEVVDEVMARLRAAYIKNLGAEIR